MSVRGVHPCGDDPPNSALSGSPGLFFNAGSEGDQDRRRGGNRERDVAVAQRGMADDDIVVRGIELPHGAGAARDERRHIRIHGVGRLRWRCW